MQLVGQLLMQFNNYPLVKLNELFVDVVILRRQQKPALLLFMNAVSVKS